MPSVLISEYESEKQSSFHSDKIFDSKAQETENISEEMSSTFTEDCEMPENNNFDATQTVKIVSKVAFDILKCPTPVKLSNSNSNSEVDINMPEVPFKNGINHICALDPSITTISEAVVIPDMILHSKSVGTCDVESNGKVQNANQESLGLTPEMSSKIKNVDGSYFESSYSVSPSTESSTSKVKRGRGRPRKVSKSSTLNSDQYLLPIQSSVDDLRMDSNDMKILMSNPTILSLNETKSYTCKTRATKRLKLDKVEISNSTKFLPTAMESIAAEVSYVLNTKPINLASEFFSSSENHEFHDNNQSEVVEKVSNVISEVKRSRGRPKKNQNKTATVSVFSMDSQLQNVSNTNEVDVNSHEFSGTKDVSEGQSSLTEKLTLSGNESLECSEFDFSKTSELKRGRGRPPKRCKSKMSNKVSASRSLLKKTNKREMLRNISVKQINEIHSEVLLEDKFTACENKSVKGLAVDRSLKVKKHREQTKRNLSKSSIPDSNIASCLKKKAKNKKISKNKSRKQIKENHFKEKIQDQTFNENELSISSNRKVKVMNDKLMSKKDIGASFLASGKQSVKTRKKHFVPRKKEKSKVSKIKMSHDSKHKRNKEKSLKNIVIRVKKEKKLRCLKKKIFSSFETFHNGKSSNYSMDSVNSSDFQAIKENSSLKTSEVSTKSCDESKKHSSHTLQNSHSADFLSEYKPQRCLWKVLKEKDSHEYYPPMKFSPYFKSERTWNGKETSWRILKAFESEPLDDESCHNTFFTGGSVLCMAWCPIPGEGLSNQYIAITVNISEDKYHTYECLESGKCLIQLWNVGVLNSEKLKSKPAVELIIAQDHGIITEMKWCPSGCWEDPTKECSDDIFPRLGMLAVAYSDGYVRIYSLPHPHFLTNGLSFPVYETSPSIILQPLSGRNCVTQKSMCVSLDWQKLVLCERIAAGYGNGMICVWHINSNSILLVSKEDDATKVSPYLVFNAHGTPVTSLSFAPTPGGRFLLSSSYDKTLKFWDLTDISLPFCVVRKGISLCADWANLYCGAMSSLDHGMHLKDACFLHECGLEKNRVLSTPNCPTTKISVSKFLNAIAMVDKSCSLSVSFYRNVLDDRKTSHYFHRPVYLTEITPVQGIMKNSFSSLSEKFKNSSAVQDMKDIVLLKNRVVDKTIVEKSLSPNFVAETKESKTQEARSLLLANSTSTDGIAGFKTSIECGGSLLPTDIANDSCDYEAVCDISINNESRTEYTDEVPFAQVFGDRQFINSKSCAESVMSSDSTTSNSENESNVDSYNNILFESSMVDKQPEASDDSVISECSLNSNMEVDSLSEESNSSDQIYKSEVSESKSKMRSDSNSPPKRSSESEDSEKFQNFPSENKGESDIVENKFAAFNPVATCNNQVEKFGKALNFAKADKSCTKLIANNCSKDLSTNSGNVYELSRNPFSSDLSSGAFSNASGKSLLGNSSSSHFEVFQENSDILTDCKCDKNCADSVSARNKTDISDTCFAANPDKRNANGANAYIENKLQDECSEMNLLPEVDGKNIYEIKKSPGTNADSNCDSNNESSRVPCEDSPAFDAKAITSTLNLHENGESQYGLVFKDMNTVDFESIADVYIKEDNLLLFEKDPILSVKAVAWNPNYNSCSWLFSAGHSGFARISYISDMEGWKDSKKIQKDSMM